MPSILGNNRSEPSAHALTNAVVQQPVESAALGMRHACEGTQGSNPAPPLRRHLTLFKHACTLTTAKQGINHALLNGRRFAF